MNKTISITILSLITAFSLNAQVNILSNAINFRTNSSNDWSKLTYHYGSMSLTGSNGTSAFSATYPANGASIDASGVYGYSVPKTGYGYGGKFTGGYRGVDVIAGTNGSTVTTRPTFGGYFLAYNNNSPSACAGIFATCQGTGTAPKWAGFFSGNVYSSGTYSTSDASVKTNVEDLSGSLQKVMQLLPKRYDFDTEKFPNMGLETGKKLGLFAQDVEGVLPEVVITVDLPEECQSNGVKSIMAINYAEIIPVLVGAIQEQQKMIKKQQQEIDNIKNQLGLR